MSADAEALNQVCHGWLNYLFHATWQATIVILLALLLVRVGRRMSSHLRYAILLVAFAKLIVPPFMSAPLGLFSHFSNSRMFSLSASGIAEEQAISLADGRLSSGDGVFNSHFVTDLLGTDDTTGSDDGNSDVSIAGSEGSVTQGTERRVNDRPNAPASLSASAWLVLFYVIGVFLVAAAVFRQTRHLAHLASTATEVVSGPLYDSMQSISKRLNLYRKVTLLLSDQPVAPLAFGLFRPAILLPRRFISRLSVAERGSVLAHELTHHRRMDQAVVWIQAALMCLWWFNPLVWLVNRQVRRVREECCDDRLLHDNLVSVEVYGNTLLRIAEYLSLQVRTGTVVWCVPYLHPLCDRIARVTDDSIVRRRHLSTVGLIAVIVFAVGLLPGMRSIDTATAGAPDGVRVAKSDSTASVPMGNAKAGHDLYGDPLPDGALVRLGTVRFRPGVGIRIPSLPVAFVGEGQLLITPFQNRIRFWDRIEGNVVGESETGKLPIDSLAVSSDGRRLVTFSSARNQVSRERRTRLQLWDLSVDEIGLTPIWSRPFDVAVNCLRFSPDGSRVVVAGGAMRDASIRMIDSTHGDQVVSNTFELDSIGCISLNPHGHLVAIGHSRGAALWDWRTHGELIPLDLPSNRSVSAIEFSADGRTLVTLSDEPIGIRLWNVATRQLVRRLETGEDRYHADQINMTDDGRYLIVPANRRSWSVELWDIESGQLSATLGRGTMWRQGLTLSNDQQWLAAASGDLIQVWNLTARKSIDARFEGHNSSVLDLAFDRTGQLLASASADGTVRIWNASAGRQERLLEHEREIRKIAFSPSGKRVASSGMDSVVGIWDVQSGRRLHALAGHALGGNRALRFSIDGRRLYSWGDDFHLRVWDVESGKQIASHVTRPSDFPLVERAEGGFEPAIKRPMPGYFVAKGEFASDASQFVLTIDGTLYCFDTNTGDQVKRFRPEGDLQAVAISPDGRWIVTNEASATDPTPSRSWVRQESWRSWIRIRDYRSLEVVHELEIVGQHQGPVVFSPNGELMAVVITNRTASDFGNQYERWVEIIATRTGRSYARMPISDVQMARLAFSPNGKRLATCHADTTMLVWNVDDFRLR